MSNMNTTTFPQTTTFPDGGTWSLVAPTLITYEGPRGPNRWEFPTETEAMVAWVSVLLH